MVDTRRKRRAQQKAEAELIGSDRAPGADDATPQAKSVRPRPGPLRRAYDAAAADVAGNLETASKTANAQLAAVEAANRRYQEALAAYDALLAEAPGRTKPQREKQEAALKMAERRYQLARQGVMDMRRVVTTNTTVVAQLIKAGKVSHDAQLGEKIGRMRVTGMESSRTAMLAPQPADDVDSTVH